MTTRSTFWVGRYGLILGLLLVSSSAAGAQVIVSTGPATIVDASPVVIQFEDTQQTLFQGFMQLASEGATSDQLNSWIAANEQVIESQQLLLGQIGLAADAQPVQLTYLIQVPVGASQECSDFLTTQATLSSSYVQLWNQGSGNQAVVLTTFQQGNAASLQDQGQRLQDLADSAATLSIPSSGPPVTPTISSPQWQAYFSLQSQTAQSRIALWNQLTSATPAVRDASLIQWQTQNASNLQELQTLGLSLSATISSSPAPIPAPAPVDSTNPN